MADAPSFEEIMQFDPFPQDAGGEPEPVADDTGQAGEEDDQKQPEKKGAAGQEPPKEEPVEEEEPKPALTQQPPAPDLAALMAGLPNQIANAVSTATRPAEQQVEKPAGNKFNLGMPPALVAALRSEDPKEFEQGVGAMVNGVANHVWNSTMEHIQNELLPAIPRMIQSYVEQQKQQQDIAGDFYGTYKNLDHPSLRPLVQHTGMLIAQEGAAKGIVRQWDAALRDEIAERIYTTIPALRPAAKAANGGTPPPKKKFAPGGGSRAGNSGGNQAENEMLDVMGIFGPPAGRG